VKAFLTTANAVSDGFHGAIGIGVVTDDAFGVGVSAVPDPLDEMEWDGWLWHSFFDIHTAASPLDDGVNAATVGWQKDIDSKAMRKLNLGDTIFAIAEVTMGGTAVMQLFLDTRVLLKLP